MRVRDLFLLGASVVVMLTATSAWAQRPPAQGRLPAVNPSPSGAGGSGPASAGGNRPAAPTSWSPQLVLNTDPKPVPWSPQLVLNSDPKPAARPGTITFSGTITSLISLASGDRGPIPPQLVAIVVSNGATTSQFSVGPHTRVTIVNYFGNPLVTGQTYTTQRGTLASLQVGQAVTVVAEQVLPVRGEPLLRAVSITIFNYAYAPQLRR